jgi:hypothetical protein
MPRFGKNNPDFNIPTNLVNPDLGNEILFHLNFELGKTLKFRIRTHMHSEAGIILS